MDIYWQSTNWQNKNLASRQTITFFISVLVIGLLFLIPINNKYAYLQQDHLMSVELIKTVSLNKKKTQELEKPLIPIIDPIESNAKTIVEKSVVKAKSISKPIPITTRISPSQDKTQLPSARMIINSFKNRKTLQTVSKDFQATSESDNNFIIKKIHKQKPPMVVSNKIFKQTIVNHKDPATIKTTKSVLGFLFGSVKDRKKNQDTLSYCPALGRRSVFCPSSNPLID